MPNVNTRDILTAELSRHPRASSLTHPQRAQVIEQATPFVKVAGGNHAVHLDQAINNVLYGIPPVPSDKP
jgi:hypothetical protein